MKFILTIDTEADNQWDHGCDLTVENIKYIPRFQELCDKYEIKPTYLVTSEVCDDAFAKELFSDYLLSGKAEIGAHLHSWTTPPFRDKEGLRFNDVNHAFASELPVDLLEEKIRKLTEQIESSFGKRPLSFRSGRYGFNENVARALAGNSYLVDSSVTPYTSWSSHKGMPGASSGPDFIDDTPVPYRYNFENDSLLELPVTILPTKFPLNKSDTLARYYFRNVNKSIPLKGLRKLLFRRQPLWLRPFGWMEISMLKELLDEATCNKLPYLIMMFHSSELMPGCSKEFTDNKAIGKLYVLLENFFALLKDKSISSLTLTEAAKEL